MEFSSIAVPEIYKSSADFRFFLNWFSECLSKTKYDIDNIMDLLDPERCPSELLWLLADTMGFKYDDRLNTSFNRLVLLYFMSMIYIRGSKNGVTLAAEVNLAQFNLNKYAEENPALAERLEDTSIPVNSAYVTPHVEAGYIDVVYFSEKEPIDACIEYVRPLGMYLFQHSGVRVDARSKVTVDARLTNTSDMGISIGPTHVGHYRRRDYAAMQTASPLGGLTKRDPVYYRNSDFESNHTSDTFEYKDNVTIGEWLDRHFIIESVNLNFDESSHKVKIKDARILESTKVIVWFNDTSIDDASASKIEGSTEQGKLILEAKHLPLSTLVCDIECINSDNVPPTDVVNPGYRTLYSLQLCNNEHIFKSLLPDVDPIFSLGKATGEVSTEMPDDYLKDPDDPRYNLRYDKDLEESMGQPGQGPDVYTLEPRSTWEAYSNGPVVNRPMQCVNDAMEMEGPVANEYFTKAEPPKGSNVTIVYGGRDV